MEVGGLKADGEGLGVRSDVDRLGKYRPVVTYEADRSWVLHEPEHYAADVIQVVAAAEHDAAVLRMMREQVGVTDGASLALVLGDIRQGRPTEVRPLPSMVLEPLCTPDGRAVVAIAVDGHERTQATAEQMRQHATATLMVAATTKLDQQVYEVMRGQFDMGESARGFVEALIKHWPEPRTD